MGRYESQRAIAARTISERRKGRKRPLRWGFWFFARFSGLVLTCAAILAAAWFLPLLLPADPPARAPAPAAPPIEGGSEFPVGSELAADEAPPVRRSRRSRPVEAEAVSPTPAVEEFDVLTPPELDAISQAD